MSNKRNKYNPEFKAKVSLAALKNDETISGLAVQPSGSTAFIYCAT